MQTHNVRVSKINRLPKKEPQWFCDLAMPTRLRDRLRTLFTLHRDGYVNWYRGAVRFCCGRKTPPAEVEAHWEEKRKELDAAIDKRKTKPSDSMPLKVLLSLYIDRQTRRVETGRPKPLSRFTLEDQIRTLRRFAKQVGADREASEIDASDFNAYAVLFDKRSASTMARNVAYVKAMFAWGDDAGHCKAPTFGPDFIKPPEAVRRDERLQKAKSYTPDELQKLWKAARREERIWIALGINCAFDNSDISNLTWEVVDLAAGVIDFRRRKIGRVRRVIPLMPRTLRLLKAYRNVGHGGGEGAAGRQTGGGYVFATPAGHRLVRMKERANGRASPIDFVSARWTALLQTSKIRPKSTTKRKENGGKRELIWKSKGDGRGFRGLRTTFANHIRPGYGDEQKIIMGHSHGTTFLDNYLESVGMERLRELVIHVWAEMFKGPPRPDSASSRAKISGGPA